MVGQRRFGPLIAVVAVALGVVYLRMVQVQVHEHAIWAREAANLLRSSKTLPYHRGRILDRDGVVMVQDEDVYRIELVHRSFRREHPLGQVAHARTELEGRHVSLRRAAGRVEEWALDLCRLSPNDVERFADGGALALPDLAVPATAAPGADRRRARAADLRFYVQALLGLSRRERGDLRQRVDGGEGERSWLELAARVGGEPPDALERRLRARWRASTDELARLALLLDLRHDDDLPPGSRAEALELLVERLERTRLGIEEEVASELFRQATGFSPGRIETDALTATFDLRWIGELVGWGPERLEEWLASRRERWREVWEELAVPGARIKAELRAEKAEEHPVDALLGELAMLYAGPSRDPRADDGREWRRWRPRAVLAELPDLFEGLAPSLEAGPVLPIDDPALRRSSPLRESPWALLERALAAPVPGTELEARWREAEWSPPADAAEAGARWQRLLERRRPTKAAPSSDREHLIEWTVAGWEQRFQDAVRARLASLRVAAREQGLAVPLALSAVRVERAREQADYVIRDRGSRPVLVTEDPSYEVVHLLTRYPDRFRGFEVREATRRYPVALDGAGEPVARELVGVVRQSSLKEVLAQRRNERELFDLRRRTTRTAEDRAEMRRLVAQLYRYDELHGTSGVEGLLDEALRGENGYRESEGLEEREERRREGLFIPPVDGEDVRLTLDLDLQEAARACLERPELPADEALRDLDWFRSPVGAIVLLRPDGAVLAAVSCPGEPGTPSPGRDGQELLAIERTLRMHTFQPLGSIFKVFVAVYALDHLGLDPLEPFPCEVRPELGQAGWGKVRCHRRYGHGTPGLREAIEGSCNSYFAALGERVGSMEAFASIAHSFGFDEPTGVRAIGTRGGLVEDWEMRSFRRGRGFRADDLQRAGNGLSVIEGTPMQVARATAGLATGVLPEVRLVEAIGDRAVPPRGRRVPASRPRSPSCARRWPASS